MSPKSRQPDPVATAREIARSQQSNGPACQQCGQIERTPVHAPDGNLSGGHKFRPAVEVLRVALPGIPEQCPFCRKPVAFNLAYFAGQLRAVCPACFEPVAIIAVTNMPAEPPSELCQWCGGKYRSGSGRCRDCHRNEYGEITADGPVPGQVYSAEELGYPELSPHAEHHGLRYEADTPDGLMFHCMCGDNVFVPTGD